MTEQAEVGPAIHLSRDGFQPVNRKRCAEALGAVRHALSVSRGGFCDGALPVALSNFGWRAFGIFSVRRRPKTTESRQATRPRTSVREIPVRASTFQTPGMIDTSVIRERFTAVERDLNERARRLLAAAEAKTAGHGGITAASRATGVARSTIGRGLKDLAGPGSLSGQVRRPGGGGPTLVQKDPTLLENLRLLVGPATMGDPTMSPPTEPTVPEMVIPPL